MPFVSQAQAGWAFANKKPFAKRWARQTGPYKRLPYKVRAKALTLAHLEAFVTSPHYDPDTAAAIAARVPEIPSLKGEQIAPGITRIHGNLCNVHGRYGKCPGASVTPPKVALHRGRKPRKGAKPKKAQLTPEQKRMQRTTEHAQNRQKVLNGLGIAADGQSALGDLADGEQPRDPSAIERGGLVAAGLVEQAKDGSYRLSASGRAAMSAAASGDAGRTGAIISAARDRTTARGERTQAATARHEAATARQQTAAAERLTRQQVAQAKRAARQAKRGSGGGKKPAPKAPAHDPSIRVPHRAHPSVGSGSSPSVTSDGGSKPPKPPAPPKPIKTPAPAKQIAPALQTAAQTLSDGKTLSDSDSMALIRNGLAHLVKGELVLTAAGQRATMKAAPTLGDYLVVEDPAKSSTWHLQVKRNGKPDHGLMGAAWAALHGGYRGNVYAGPNKGAALTKLRALYTSEKMPMPAEKAASFRVFKDAAGRPRWVAQSSTAYQDRDQEIVSTNALQDDCAFADAHQSYGPLRWWHTPGLDLGDCDFNAMHGKVLIESGTFRSPAIAQKVAAAADALEISLGFLHLPSEPDASGVFHHIRKFERSLVPRGKASNRFTAFRVKESRMFDPTKVAALKTLGFSDDDITSLQAQAEATEKAATEQQVAFKADEPATQEADVTPELPDIIVNGVTYKAFPPKAAAAAAGAPVEGSPEEEAAESPEEEQAEMDAGEGDAMDGGGLTLSPEDIQAIGQAVSDALTTALGPLVSTMDLTNKIGSHMDELKGMMGGYTTKKDATDAEKAEQITALKAQQEATQAKLDELLGLQPATPARATTAPQTALNPFNPADNALLASVKDQIPADQQMFSNGFEDLTRNLFNRG